MSSLSQKREKHLKEGLTSKHCTGVDPIKLDSGEVEQVLKV